MLCGMTCLPTSKDITIASGFIPPLGISPPNKQSAKPLDLVSTKSREVIPSEDHKKIRDGYDNGDGA
jgi:hypothetical protein